jgi:trehalose 6-phosphate synthase
VHEFAVLANRLPVSFDDRSGWQRSPGGLVSALEPIVRRRRGLWIGSAERSLDELHRQSAFPMAQLGFTPTDRAHFYNGICNRTLWPALHGMSDLVEFEPHWWEAYERCNFLAGEMTAETAAEAATVWIHDYHFALVPQMLRDARPDLSIGVFLHTPVDPAIGELAVAGELATGWAAADVVGVQTPVDHATLAGFLDRFANVDVVVDGSDAASVADGIYQAVHTEPAIRRARAARLAATVRAAPVEQWARRCLQAIVKGPSRSAPTGSG